MAGMEKRYTEQLVLLTTPDNRDLVEGLELLLRSSGDAVSRADVLRQLLEPGLKEAKEKHGGRKLDQCIRQARAARVSRARKPKAQDPAAP